MFIRFNAKIQGSLKRRFLAEAPFYLGYFSSFAEKYGFLSNSVKFTDICTISDMAVGYGAGGKNRERHVPATDQTEGREQEAFAFIYAARDLTLQNGGNYGVLMLPYKNRIKSRSGIFIFGKNVNFHFRISGFGM